MYNINLLKSSHPLLWRNPEKNVYIRTESYRLFPLININKRLRVNLCSHKTKTWTMRNLLCDCGHQRRVRWIAGGGGGGICRDRMTWRRRAPSRSDMTLSPAKQPLSPAHTKPASKTRIRHSYDDANNLSHHSLQYTRSAFLHFWFFSCLAEL